MLCNKCQGSVRQASGSRPQCAPANITSRCAPLGDTRTPRMGPASDAAFSLKGTLHPHGPAAVPRQHPNGVAVVQQSMDECRATCMDAWSAPAKCHALLCRPAVCVRGLAYSWCTKLWHAGNQHATIECTSCRQLPVAWRPLPDPPPPPPAGARSRGMPPPPPVPAPDVRDGQPVLEAAVPSLLAAVRHQPAQHKRRHPPQQGPTVRLGPPVSDGHTAVPHDGPVGHNATARTARLPGSQDHDNCLPRSLGTSADPSHSAGCRLVHCQ